MRVIFFILFFLSVIILPRAAFAHGSGYPPFFKIDGELANTYFLQNAGVFYSPLTIPQDIAAKNYLPNDSIDFEIDSVPLNTVFAPEIMDKLKFAWDFGDGTKASGVKNTHTYSKIGSHILTITADYGDPNAQPLLIESALIQVVPNSSYQLPSSVIKVNEKQGKKANYNMLDFDLAQPLMFDASSSKASSKIVSYSWDFGDEKTGNKKITEHKYQLPQAFATVILRVKDEKGLFTDSIINVRNTGKNEPISKANVFQTKKPLLIGIVSAVLAFGTIGLFMVNKKKK